MADTSADDPVGASSHPGGPEERSGKETQQAGGLDEQTRARLSSPLVIGCLAYAILAWMILVVVLVYLWKVFGS